MRLLVALVWFGVSLGVLAPRTAHAQTTPQKSAVVAGAAGAAAAAAATEDDEVASDSPRASVQRYLELCRQNEWEPAATYLELSKADAKRGAALAEELCAVLNRRLYPDSEDLSPLSTGRKEDGLPANTDDIGRIADRAQQKVPVRLVRREAKDGEEARWIFSLATVSHVDAWYENLDDRYIRQWMLPSLLREGPYGFLLWQLIAFPLFIGLALLLGRLVVNGLVAVGSKIVRRGRVQEVMRDAKGALGLLLATGLVRASLPYAGFYLTAYDVVTRVLSAALAVSIVWLAIVASRAVLRGFSSRVTVFERAGRLALLDLAQRASRIVLVFVGIVWVISAFGYHVGTIVTGLGIGGIAVALAAQKTLENVIGSVAILADQPFRIGETVRVDGTEGTVETIGLRSTRIRTNDRTIVSIPNGKLADMKIEAFGARDRFRLQLKLDVAQSNDPAAIQGFVETLRARLSARPEVRKDDLLVRANHVSAGIVEVEVSTYLVVASLNVFVEERHKIVLDVLMTARARGLVLCEPVRFSGNPPNPLSPAPSA